MRKLIVSAVAIATALIVGCGSQVVEFAAYYEGVVAASAMGGGGGGEIDLVSGLAEVGVNLEVGYARKIVQTHKAELVKKPAPSQENQNHV